MTTIQLLIAAYAAADSREDYERQSVLRDELEAAGVVLYYENGHGGLATLHASQRGEILWTRPAEYLGSGPDGYYHYEFMVLRPVA